MNYNQDVFVECMIKKRLSSKDLLIFLGIGILGAILVFAGVYVFLLTGMVSIAFFALVGAVLGAYYLFTKRNVEFEYAVTNGDLSVDKITNRRSRKRLTSFDCKDVEEFGSYNEKMQALKNRTFDKRIFASVFEDGRDARYIIAKSKKTGMTLLVFDPDERTVDAMKPYMPRQIRLELMGRK